MDIWKELRDEGVDSGLLDEVRRFREAHPLTPEAQERVPVPKYLYYGREVWESAAAALLCGEHLLLAGPKATGKNVLAEDLAALFGRPVWDVSMYVNVDAAALILVYGGFADAELLGGGADGGPVLYHVQGQFFGPLLQIVSHNATLPCRCALSIWRNAGGYDKGDGPHILNGHLAGGGSIIWHHPEMK